MSKKKALGQGLDALLGGDIDLNSPEPIEDAIDGLRMLSIDELQPNPDQPREHFGADALAELAESIKQQGVIQPILAEHRADGGFLIVAGERRWRASALAGLREIPVIVREFSAAQKLEIALVENVQRENLTPLEEARAYRHIMDKLGLSQQDVADKVGKNRSTVANSLRLLKLPETMRTSIEQGNLTAGHARALLSVTNPADQELLFKKILDRELSVRDAESMATDMNRGHKGGDKNIKVKNSLPVQRDPELETLEQKFIELLGTRVFLRGSLKKGKMEISWFSQDDLDRLYGILTAKG